MDIFEYIRGMADCRNGVHHKEGEGDSYDAGYAAQYELEQVMSWRGFN